MGECYSYTSKDSFKDVLSLCCLNFLSFLLTGLSYIAELRLQTYLFRHQVMCTSCQIMCISLSKHCISLPKFVLRCQICVFRRAVKVCVFRVVQICVYCHQSMCILLSKQLYFVVKAFVFRCKSMCILLSIKNQNKKICVCVCVR